MSYKREKSILFFSHLSLLFFILFYSIAAIICFPIFLLQLGLFIENGTNHKFKRITIINLQYKKTSNKSTK